MPRPKNFSKQQIGQAAFDIVRAHGLGALSARNIARELKTSTSPVFGHFRRMRDLQPEIVERTLALLRDYQTGQQTRHRSGEPFYDMGLGYIEFARREQHLFREVLNEASGEHLKSSNRFGAEMIPLMKRDRSLKGLGDEALRAILFKMWVFVHGLASLSVEGILDGRSEKELERMLHEVGTAVITAAQETK